MPSAYVDPALVGMDQIIKLILVMMLLLLECFCMSQLMVLICCVLTTSA